MNFQKNFYFFNNINKNVNLPRLMARRMQSHIAKMKLPEYF